MDEKTRDGNVTLTPAPAGFVPYPFAEHHAWGAWAALAVEMPGYGDLEATNPYTGRTLHLAEAFKGGADAYTALRRLVDAMEKHQFLGEVTAQTEVPAAVAARVARHPYRVYVGGPDDYESRVDVRLTAVEVRAVRYIAELLNASASPSRPRFTVEDVA